MQVVLKEPMMVFVLKTASRDTSGDKSLQVPTALTDCDFMYFLSSLLV
jgi:hypothetical protein